MLEVPLTKYIDDWNRIEESGFRRIVAEARRDPDSRRLMVFNDQNYDKIYPCFTSFQFVATKRKEFDMYVYQRSADVAKLKDDLVFFGTVAKEFQRATLMPVTKIVVVYGHCHIETKE